MTDTPAAPTKRGPRTRATPLQFVAHGRQIYDNQRADGAREIATAYDPVDAVLIAIALNTGEVIRDDERAKAHARISDLQAEQTRQLDAWEKDRARLTEECARLRAALTNAQPTMHACTQEPK